MKLDEHLRELGDFLDIAGLEFDEQGGAGLYLPDGLEIGLRREHDDIALTIFAVLRVLPNPERYAVALLQASLLGEHTAGACISLGLDAQGRDCLVLWRRLTLSMVDTVVLADEIGRFADAARAWREQALPGDEVQSAAVSPAAVPPVSAFFSQRA